MAGRAATLKSTAKPTQPAQSPAPAPAVTERSREERFTEWVTHNLRFIGIGLGIIALVVLVVVFMTLSNRRKEIFARQSLENAWATADAGNVPQASAELQRVASTYRGTDAAHEATLSLNQTRLMAGQHQLAVDDLRQFLAGNPPARFRPSANLLLGSALENLNQPAEAAAAFMVAFEAAELDHMKAEALLSAGRAYLTAGDTAKAIEAYQRIVDQYRETAAFPIAEVRLGELVK
jgi:predicted negative regulator of RcsB-dependent stress response